MQKLFRKYPFLCPMLGLLVAYLIADIAESFWLDSPFWWLPIACVFGAMLLGYGVGFERIKGVWRWFSVFVFHVVLGSWWFSQTGSSTPSELPWNKLGANKDGFALVEVRDSWLAGPKGVKGTAYCMGFQLGDGVLRRADFGIRASVADGVLNPPAMGRYWVFLGAIRAYDQPEIPGDPNWQQIMLSMGIGGHIRYWGDWQRAGNGNLGGGVGYVYRLRARLLVWIHGEFGRRLHSQHAGLVYAMLMGDKSGLDPALESQFGTAGLLHVLAVSGMHVALIMGALFWLFSGFGARGNPGLFSLFVLLAAGWGYTFLTGAGASVIRAMISATWMWLGKYAFKRKQALIHVLLGSAYIQWLIDPPAVEQMGFQLSYLAVLGIALLHPLVSEQLSNLPRLVRWLAENTSLTLSATLFTLPLLLWQFQSFPTWFLLGNLLLLPLFSICVYLTLVCLSVGWIPILGDMIYRLFGAGLKALLGLLDAGQSLPLPQIKVLPMSGWDLLLLLLLMVLVSGWLVSQFRKIDHPHGVRVSWKRFNVSASQGWFFGITVLFLCLWANLERERNQRRHSTESFKMHVGREMVEVRKVKSRLQIKGDWRNSQMKIRAWHKLQKYAVRNGVAHVIWINRLPLYYE